MFWCMKKPNFLGIIIDGSFTISAFGYGSSTAVVGICIDKQIVNCTWYDFGAGRR